MESQSKDDEDAEEAIGREKHVVCDFQKGGFSAVFWTEAGLEGFIEIMETEVGFELIWNRSFKDFRQEGEVRDVTAVVGDIGVKTRFSARGWQQGA